MNATIHLPEITRKHLSRCILLLGSPHDGEVLAAARATQRVLAAAGCDLHDLVAALLGPSRPQQQAHKRRTTKKADPDWMVTVRALLEHEICCLSDWERDFLRVVEKYRLDPSPRQLEIIARLERQVHLRHAKRDAA